MEFFNASVTLHRLIGKTIGRLYGHNLGYDALLYESDSIPRILEMESDLQDWSSACRKASTLFDRRRCRSIRRVAIRLLDVSELC